MYAYLIDLKDGVPDLVFPVPESGCLVGRDAGCMVQISDSRISRMHVRIASESGHWFVEDLKTRNGTRVNGQPVTRVEVKDGDRIHIGPKELLFSTQAPDRTNFVPNHVIDLSTLAEHMTMTGRPARPPTGQDPQART